MTPLEHWDYVVTDIAAVYGIDLYDPTLERSWAWLRRLIIAVCGIPGTRMNTVVFPNQKTSTT